MKIITKDTKKLIKQPIDGLLYDLDLLPEQIKDDSWLKLIAKVIKELHKNAINKKNKILTKNDL